jgi:mercuric reductase
VVTSPAASYALLAMVGTDHVLDRWSGYDAATDRVRVALLQHYLEFGHAPFPVELGRRLGLSEATVRQQFQELRHRDLVILQNEGIVGAYPFTDRDSGHLVALEGRTLNAMCAVDALGIGAMTGREVTVVSSCRHCGVPIQIATRDRGRGLAEVEPNTAVMWQSVRYEDSCAANSLCAKTVFYCSDDHLSAWRNERPADEPGFRLSVEEALEVGRALFGPSLAGIDAAERTNNDIETRGTPRPSPNPSSTNGTLAERRSGTNRRTGSAYDLVVIGAGSAGFSAAITAVDQGAKVALIGSGTIGGTCVNVGCVPSKTLIRAAETLHNTRAASRFAGIAAEAKVTDWRETIRQKDELVAELRQAKYADLLPAYNGIAYREGSARLVEGGVEINGTHVPADKVIIATGARPAVPTISGY